MKCSICEKKALTNISIPINSEAVTESGKVVDTIFKHSKEYEMEASVIAPLCEFHIFCLEDGLIEIRNNQIIFLGQLTLQQIEKVKPSDSELRNDIKRLEKNSNYSIGVQMRKTYLRYKRFQKKEIEDVLK